MPKTLRGWAAWFAAQGALTFIWRWIIKLAENAMLGYGDEKIALWLGSSTIAAALTWLIPFAFAAATLWVYHWIQVKWVGITSKPVTHRKESLTQMLPIAGLVIGGLLFIVSVAWILNENRRASDENRRATDEITKQLGRYVFPRHLTEDQKKIIADYLLQFPPVKDVKMQVQKDYNRPSDAPGPIGEAMGFAGDIRDALTQGGWEILPPTYVDIPSEGLGWSFMQPPQSQQVKYDAKHPRPDTLLYDAFRKAKVFGIQGTGSGTSANITQETLTINIGKRRMDDGDKIGRQRALQNLLKRAQDLQEELNQ